MQTRITIKNVPTLMSTLHENNGNDVVKIDLSEIQKLDNEILKSVIEIIPLCSNLETIDLSRRSHLLKWGSALNLDNELIRDLLLEMIMNTTIKLVNLQGIGIKLEHNEKLARLSKRSGMKLNLNDTDLIAESGSRPRAIVASLSFLTQKAVLRQGTDIIRSANLSVETKTSLESLQTLMIYGRK